MIKQRQLDISATNIANLGTELEKNVRLAAAKTENQWKGAGAAVGLQIWRIEAFKVVPWPKESYGRFYTGDSYIVLNTYQKNPNSPALAWDVHFWLGMSTTQDEAGTAAYKTVELDDFLGGAPVQHREVQDWESQLFLSYFPKGIVMMEGGVASGFNVVGPKNYQPRLLQLKGKRNVRLREVPLAAASVNSGDVFILDLGMLLLQFNGSKSAGVERSKAAEICRAIDRERGEKPEVKVFEEGDKDMPKEWVEKLGKGPYASAQAGGDDLAYDKQPSGKKLIKLSDASGKLVMTPVGEGAAVTFKSLDTNDVFIVDIGTEVFAWIGKKASAGERKLGMKYAQMYLKEAKRPETLPISRVLEGAENLWFMKTIGN